MDGVNNETAQINNSTIDVNQPGKENQTAIINQVCDYKQKETAQNNQEDNISKPII
jgi:hypothetical protein